MSEIDINIYGSGNNSGTKLVMAGATWCGHCQNTKKMVEDNNISEDQLKVHYCDEDPDHPVCDQVQGFPTFKTCSADDSACEETPVHVGAPQSVDQLNELIAKTQ